MSVNLSYTFWGRMVKSCGFLLAPGMAQLSYTGIGKETASAPENTHQRQRDCYTKGRTGTYRRIDIRPMTCRSKQKQIT